MPRQERAGPCGGCESSVARAPAAHRPPTRRAAQPAAPGRHRGAPPSTPQTSAAARAPGRTAGRPRGQTRRNRGEGAYGGVCRVQGASERRAWRGPPVNSTRAGRPHRQPASRGTSAGPTHASQNHPTRQTQQRLQPAAQQARLQVGGEGDEHAVALQVGGAALERVVPRVDLGPGGGGWVGREVRGRAREAPPEKECQSGVGQRAAHGAPLIEPSSTQPGNKPSPAQPCPPGGPHL